MSRRAAGRGGEGGGGRGGRTDSRLSAGRISERGERLRSAKGLRK